MEPFCHRTRFTFGSGRLGRVPFLLSLAVERHNLGGVAGNGPVDELASFLGPLLALVGLLADEERDEQGADQCHAERTNQKFDHFNVTE